MNYGQIVFAVGLVAITSLVTYRGENQFRRRRHRNLSAAFGALFDWVGVFTLFFWRIWRSGLL